MSVDTLFIPIAHSADAIQLSLNDLPASGKWPSATGGDGFALSEMLGNELAHPDLWLRVAMAYFEADNLAAFENLLRDFTSEDCQHAYSDDRYKSGRINIFNTLAAYETRKASLAPRGVEQDSAYNHATDLYNRSADLDTQATLTWVGKGVLMLLKGNIDEASVAFNSALLSDLHKDNVLVRLGLGCIAVQKRQYAEALKHYKSALQANPSLPGYVRLGLAVCYYYLGDTTQCRASFQRVLDLSEGENVHALLGLATLDMNVWRERANQVEIESRKSGTTSATWLAAQLKALESDRAVTSAFDLLQKAFALDPANPHALLLLAAHAFHTGEWKKAREFASRAEVVCEGAPSLATAECRGLAAFNVARACHAAGAHQEAMRKYEQAKALIPNHPPTCLGYAQMLVSVRSETEQAIEVLEAVIAGANRQGQHQDAKQMAAAASNNFEVLRLLGSLYAMQPSPSALMTKAASLGKKDSSKDKKDKVVVSLPDFDKAYAYLKKSVDLHPNSLELLLEFAEVAARMHEYAQAYLSYKRLLKLMTELYKIPLETLSAEMLNNFGVVCQQLKRFAEAREYFDWSLRNSSSAAAAAGTNIPADKVTTHYNLGLLAEAGSTERALGKMQEVLDQYPNYTDAMLYSGLVHQRSGNFAQAKTMFDRAHALHAAGDAAATASAAANLPVIQCAIGNWHLSQHEVDGAKSAFDSILMKMGQLPSGGARKDDYAKLSLGNLHMHRAVRKIRSVQLSCQGMPPDHPQFESKMRAAQVDWKEVSAFFENVLRSDPRNLYAAHGLACVLAHQGKTLEAKEMFQQIKDMTAAAGTGGEEIDMPDVWVNLGHVYVAQGSYVSAVKMYQHCLRNFRDTRSLSTVQILTYLARAFYLSDAFQEAKKTLLQALHLAPNSTPLWYNLGLVSEAYAIDIFQKPPAFRTYREVESAILELNQAFALFSKLQTSGQTKQEKELFGDIADKAGRHSVYCRISITNGQPHLVFARQREEEQARLLEESRVAKSRLDSEAQEAAARAEAQATADRERQEEEARAKKKYLEDISATWETVRNEEGPSVKKERVDRGGEGGEEYKGLDAEAEVARRRDKVKSRSAPSKKRVKRESGSGSDEEDEPERKKKKRKDDKKKGKTVRSKYAAAEGSDAERSPSPAKREPEPESDDGGMDVDAELAARRAKASPSSPRSNRRRSVG
jgi:RNA polymerase-associated protein CTR9